MSRRRQDPPEAGGEATITPVSIGGVAGLIVDVPVAEEALPASLTAAERAIVALVLEGRSNQEIARLRGRSYRTIANQLAEVYRKLGVNSRNEMIARLAGGAPG